MRGYSIKYLKLDKSEDSAARVAELNLKADKSDLDDYYKVDGSRAMTGDLNMNNYLIQNVKDPVNADNCVNKKYVDDTISKANIKPSHTPKNAFKYLIGDVNEWSSEYNIKVEKFIDLQESPHSWDKRVLSITPIKDGVNYRFRLGLQMFPVKTNETYSLIVELYNRDFKTWGRQETYVNGTGIWLKSYNTTKFQHQYGSSGDLYYTRTLIKFNKTSSSGPVQIYFTIHYDDNGGDMNTYPKEFKNQLYILAYGIIGETDHVDSEVYDKHEAFEIDKTKMKMLVPLDMGDNAIKNVSNLSRSGFISIYGAVHRSKYFTTEYIALKFKQIKIDHIKIYATYDTRNKDDVIKILDKNLRETRYPFRFPNTPIIIHIRINRYFDVINAILLENTTNVSFEIKYSLFY